MNEIASITKTIRLTPREAFMIEIAARTQRRNMSNFISTAAALAAEIVQFHEGHTVGEKMNDLWHIDPNERLRRMKKFDPSLLTYAEELNLAEIEKQEK